MSEQLKTGTTTIGIVNSEGVVLASERRATMGNIIAHKEVQKVFKIDDNLGLTTAGLVGDAQILARYIKAEVELYKLKRQAPMTVKSAATLLSNILRRGGGANGFFYVGLIIGGYDKEGGHVYSIDAAGGCIRDDYVSVGSGSLFAYGVLEDHYKKDLSLDEAINLAIRSLNAAVKRDSASGDGMAVVTITSDGFIEVSDDEINKRASRMGITVPKP
ncbi:MAG: archaeal proteasome endopeptidase complex subunit beta [Methanomassiliicoccales archaeon]|nr:MAG: archaeal proteasome endopeptidase complex subunit beta [Methanomassiliicoccales archaeon]